MRLSPVVLPERCKHYILYAWFTVKAHIKDLLMKLANSTAQQDFVTPQHPFACIWALRCVVLCCLPSHGRCNFLNFFNYRYGVTNVCVPAWSQDPVHLKHYARDVTPTGQTNKRLKRGLNMQLEKIKDTNREKKNPFLIGHTMIEARALMASLIPQLRYTHHGLYSDNQRMEDPSQKYLVS